MDSEKSGPNAFRLVALTNQRIWDADPARAQKEALDAIRVGGFDGDHIVRRVGNYEGQIMAIRRGWVDVDGYGWRINDAGRAALQAAGEPVPTFFTARDDWHSRDDREAVFQFCAYEIERDGKPMLRLFEKAISCGANWGMKPLLRRDDAIALRDYLNDWIARTGTN